MLSQSDHLYFARFPNPLVTKAWPQDGKTRVTTFALYFRELAWAAPDSFLGIPDQRARGSARRWFKPGPFPDSSTAARSTLPISQRLCQPTSKAIWVAGWRWARRKSI